MVSARSIRSMIVGIVFLFSTNVVAANQSIMPDRHQSVPADRGFGQHDACFGDKYESDDDLKTGNEITIEEVLKLLNSPGT